MGYTVGYGNHSFGKFTLGGKSFEMFGNSMTFPRWTCVVSLVGTCKQICFAGTESKDPQDPSRARYHSLMEMLIIWDRGREWRSMKSQEPKGELEETLVRHPGGFGEARESSMHGSVPPCGHLYRAWLPSEALPVKTGSDHPELFLF